MRIQTALGTWILLMSSWFCFSAAAAGQTMKAGCDETARDTPITGVIRDQPFSALSYVRTYVVGRDGAKRFTRNERYPMKVARNAVGCLRIDFVDNPQEACARLDVLVPAPCSDWSVAIFDLAHKAVTHWAEGERGYLGPVVIQMSASQLEEAMHDTSEMPVPPPATPPDDPNLLVEILGEKLIQGVRVVGVRQTRTVRVDDSHLPIRSIHEVWVSPELKLVVQVIDGDPQKELTITGLDQVKRQVDETLFQPVTGYPVLSYPERASNLADDDVQHLSDWFVRSFEGAD
jgi:hypothetical protein